MHFKRPSTLYAVGLLMCFLTICPFLTGQAVVRAAEPKPVPQAPVTVNGNTLFLVQGVLSFPAEARAAAITRRIKDLSKDLMFKPESLSVADGEGTTDIMAGDLVVMSVTDQDAKLAGQPRDELAKDYAERISASLTRLTQRVQSQKPHPRWRLRRHLYRRLDPDFPSSELPLYQALQEA